jgi:fatty-acyl-CoA synthase
MPMRSQSYLHGGGTNHLIGETIGQRLDLTVARWPDREGLVVRHQNIRWTWSDLSNRATDFAAGLMALGLRRGERIGLLSPNNAEWVVVQFAAAKAGFILVPINPAYEAAEIEYILNKSACTALVMAVSFRTNDYLQLLHELAPELSASNPDMLRLGRLPWLRHVISLGSAGPGWHGFDEISTRGGPSQYAELATVRDVIQFDDPVCIMFTSGTTSTPKGVTLSHHNLINAAFRLGDELRFSEQDRLCVQVPMFHILGYASTSLTCITFGAAMVLASTWFDPLASLQAMEAERCTVLHGVPTMFIMILRHPGLKTFDLTSMRTGVMAGSPCPVEIMKRCVEDMHITQICCAFGMTEAAQVFITECDDDLEHRTETVGRILAHMEAKIVDTDGRVTEIGQPGELCVRGYAVTRGYWDEPAQTREAIDASGWLHTGDIATIRGDGYCQIGGRLKDIIIRGGENISPSEIEEFLYRHEGIEEVQVFGMPDEKYGEAVCAWIKLMPDARVTSADIQSFCEGRLAHYKVPHTIRFVDAFPSTASGKRQKSAIRSAMISELTRKAR